MKKKGKVLKITAIVLCSLLVIALALVGAVFGIFKYYYNMLDYYDPFSGDETWAADSIDDSDGISPDGIDSSLMATDDEIKMYLDQIKELDDSSSGFDVQYSEIGGTLGNIDRNYSANYISEKDDVINILLIGTDSKKNNVSGRSDVMIVVSICPSQKKIVLSSFLRDVYVSIPGHNPNRLNIAYQLGGPSLLIETMEKSFGLRIDRYVMVNYFSFVETIDKIGGVSIYMTDKELAQINSHITDCHSLINGVWDKTAYALDVSGGAGYYDLNGIQALAYARIRKVDNDFGRTNRQRNVLIAILAELKTMSPTEWNSLLNQLLPNIRTNLTETDLLSLMLKAGNYIKYDVTSMSVPSRSKFKYMTVGSKSVIGVDLDAIRELLYDNIYKVQEE